MLDGRNFTRSGHPGTNTVPDRRQLKKREIGKIYILLILFFFKAVCIS